MTTHAATHRTDSHTHRNEQQGVHRVDVDTWTQMQFAALLDPQASGVPSWQPSPEDGDDEEA